MKSPDITLRVEFVKTALYIPMRRNQGAGICQLEHLEKERLCYQGIDSPVAGYLALKRGVEVSTLLARLIRVQVAQKP